ncbi:hypothetical protein LCGC14_1004260 [marine sediment metagenome]|uniref:ATP-grasp domain-containing protein n=1 Tax=marine sediment metagenome TaxID=412755 RepID=A0A0F9N6S9_9ZZZZ
MHWIIQDNLHDERGYDVLLETVKRFKLQHTFVKVVPFTHELQPSVEPDGLSIVMGSITLGKIAVNSGWIPGCFTNENFHYTAWREHLGQHLLNHDAVVCRFGDVAPPPHEFFIRPCRDDKSFTGIVMQPDEFLEWRQRVLDLQNHYTTLDASTEVCYGAARKIYQEFRLFVVDGEVVTGSQYKLGRAVVLNAEVPPHVLEFANRMIQKWTPDRAFCLDVADTPVGLKVLEIGCLNSCGFYASDVQLLVLRLNEMQF